VSYREDGTRLDVMVITDDTGFNPKSPPTTVPPPSDTSGLSIPTLITTGSRTTARLLWSEVPGARSYTVRRVTFDPVTGDPIKTPIRTGLTTHLLTEQPGCYDVLAIFRDGTTREPPFEHCQGPSFEFTFIDINGMPLTPPWELTNGSTAGARAGTPESLHVVPAHGRFRFDFVAGGPSKVQLWFRPIVGGPDHDSFWVRMDDQPWFKWNSITGSCTRVGDFTNRPVTFTVGAGSHRFELAHREIGAFVDSIFFITDNLGADEGICND
jgi:hypothetical protein